MNKERLLKLADHLDTVDQSRFDMSTWSCGTQACAIGHACEIPEFRKAGLYLETLYGQAYPKYAEPRQKYAEYSGFDAVAKFFSISLYRANKLFDFDSDGDEPISAISPKKVAENIRNFVGEHHAS